jgi:hypothetical protein
MTEQGQTRRITDYLPIRVTVTENSTGEITAAPFSGRIIDISEREACLLMTHDYPKQLSYIPHNKGRIR